MADSFQHGAVTTLHNITQRSIEAIEAELQAFSAVRPMALILPSLYSELEQPALHHIVKELKSVNYLNSITIGLDQATETQYRHALSFFKQLPQRVNVLWNDGPRLKSIHDQLSRAGVAPTELGKGRNVWYCMGYTLANPDIEAVALHDCDIKTYDRSMLAKLIYPVANPSFRFQFSKGFYARVGNETLGGRVSRLLVTPLVRALKHSLDPSHHEYLTFLDSFRYPLAGEFSMRRDAMKGLRIPSDWGLEVGVLVEMLRNYSTRRICQVEIADIYDHKHQKVSKDNDQGGLSRMSIDIAKALFRKLATDGVTFSQEGFRTIKATYLRVALDLIDSYRCDAEMNGLKLDLHAEEQIVELFAENLIKAGDAFLTRPMDQPFVPHWTRVMSAVPDVLHQLKEAVALDQRDYGTARAA